ncbi:hypothetical protein [Azospirillum picis]|uniref:Uncharacterized protein n=1 Tax=Azospirillum picis TaxID=488438 RepID=A0ABU0MSE1_9PROT|nr:hypothetical protein [Azospirillum picis]MBP2301959.1 hypothetical protein [Azospirillum picis]MDQ0536408.1 hypothetical protein [Azospirillum picis]
MTNPTNAPEGVNAPALSITWTTRQLPGPGGGSVTISTAQAGPYALEVHDSQSRSGWPRIVLWTVEKDGRRLVEGVLDSTDDGKAAAECKARRLLADTPPEPNTNGAGSYVIPASVNGMPKRGVPRGAHADIELLFAWDAFQAAATAYQCAPDGETDRYCEMVDTIGERIEAFSPKTLEGVAIQLRYALTKYIDADCAWNVLVLSEDMEQDFRHIVGNDPHAGMIWHVIQAIDSPAARIARLGQEKPAKGPDHSSAPSA